MRLVLYLLLLSSTIYAQDKIEGVGLLKIGKTTPDIIPELAKVHRSRIREAIDQKYIGDGGAVYKLKYSDSEKAPYMASACPSAEVFYLQRYVVADVKMTDVYLIFYNGVLIDYICKGGKDLEKALQIKYGDPERSFKEKPSTLCLGQIDKDYHQRWYNDRIEASLTNYFHYGVRCNLDGDTSFSIRLPEEERDLQECHKEHARQLIDPKKKDKLKDF